MKRGQTEVRQILLVFELLIVLFIALYFYQSTHRETSVNPQILEKQVTDLALQTVVGVEQAHLVSPVPNKKKSEIS